MVGNSKNKDNEEEKTAIKINVDDIVEVKQESAEEKFLMNYPGLKQIYQDNLKLQNE
jgi:hypothetical protein